MIVLDCNAAMAMARNIEEGKALQMLLLPDEQCHAPMIFYSELGHALSKYVRGEYYDIETAVRIGNNARDLVDVFHSSEEFWPEAFTESNRLNHSNYDLEYLVLARRLGATLFTLDRRLQLLALEHGVNCISTEDIADVQ